MKRFHLHLFVEDLATSTAFYSRLFGQKPTKQRDNYAKWMLEDPRLNFAISSQAQKTGIDHLGIQVDSPEELSALQLLADAASEGHTQVQGETACCYARSNKHWTVDPQGIAWEHFLTTGDSEVFGDDSSRQAEACCIPLHKPGVSSASQTSACCIPNPEEKSEARCCAG